MGIPASAHHTPNASGASGALHDDTTAEPPLCHTVTLNTPGPNPVSGTISAHARKKPPTEQHINPLFCQQILACLNNQAPLTSFNSTKGALAVNALNGLLNPAAEIQIAPGQLGAAADQIESSDRPSPLEVALRALCKLPLGQRSKGIDLGNGYFLTGFEPTKIEQGSEDLLPNYQGNLVLSQSGRTIKLPLLEMISPMALTKQIGNAKYYHMESQHILQAHQQVKAFQTSLAQNTASGSNTNPEKSMGVFLSSACGVGRSACVMAMLFLEQKCGVDALKKMTPEQIRNEVRSLVYDLRTQTGRLFIHTDKQMDELLHACESHYAEHDLYSEIPAATEEATHKRPGPPSATSGNTDDSVSTPSSDEDSVASDAEKDTGSVSSTEDDTPGGTENETTPPQRTPETRTSALTNALTEQPPERRQTTTTAIGIPPRSSTPHPDSPALATSGGSPGSTASFGLWMNNNNLRTPHHASPAFDRSALAPLPGADASRNFSRRDSTGSEHSRTSNASNPPPKTPSPNGSHPNSPHAGRTTVDEMKLAIQKLSLLKFSTLLHALKGNTTPEKTDISPELFFPSIAQQGTTPKSHHALQSREEFLELWKEETFRTFFYQLSQSVSEGLAQHNNNWDDYLQSAKIDNPGQMVRNLFHIQKILEEERERVLKLGDTFPKEPLINFPPPSNQLSS